jgi:DNA-binding NarL/FixJ family response regulator
MINIAIVDDNQHIIKLISKILQNSTDVTVVYTAQSGKEILEKLENGELPEIILMDVNMPELNGIDTTRMIKEKYPAIKILMLTAFDDDEYIFESIMNGASGYLLKEEASEQLYLSIDVLYNGGAPMSPSIAYKTLNILRKVADKKNTAEESNFNLTKREIEILTRISEGKNYNEIAAQLFISPKTVRNHIQNIYEKLQVHNKAEAIIKAIRNNLIK